MERNELKSRERKVKNTKQSAAIGKSGTDWGGDVSYEIWEGFGSYSFSDWSGVHIHKFMEDERKQRLKDESDCCTLVG